MKPRGDSPSPAVTPAPAALGLSQVLTGSPESSPPRGRLEGEPPLSWTSWVAWGEVPAGLPGTHTNGGQREGHPHRAVCRAGQRPHSQGATVPAHERAGVMRGASGNRGADRKAGGRRGPAQGQPAEHRADGRGLVLRAASSPSCRHPWAACFLPQVRPASLTKLHVASSNRSDWTTQNQCPKGTPLARMGAPARPPPTRRPLPHSLPAICPPPSSSRPRRRSRLGSPRLCRNSILSPTWSTKDPHPRAAGAPFAPTKRH